MHAILKFSLSPGLSRVALRYNLVLTSVTCYESKMNGSLVLFICSANRRGQVKTE